MKFRDEYWFLSNMFPCKIAATVNGKRYVFSCSEALFQGLKCPERIEDFVPLNGFDAKKLGRQVKLRPDWYEIQLGLMKTIIQAKFDQNPWLKEKLKAIAGEIVETNEWHDTFWGVCHGMGENHLGKILMEIRDGL